MNDKFAEKIDSHCRLQIANSFEAVLVGRIHTEKINGLFLSLSQISKLNILICHRPSEIICAGNKTFVRRFYTVRRGQHRRRNVAELRAKIEKYRVLARAITDEQTAQRISELTDELEQQARDIERGK